jgi:hypothetical protein
MIMPTGNDSKTGQCRCGRLQFAVHAKPLMTMACHCDGCQRMTASAFSLSAIYTADAFVVTQGEAVIGGLHGASRHYFCDFCKSWLFTRPEGMDQFVNVRATLMEDARAYVPFVETFTSEKLPWAVTPAVYGFARLPPQEQFPQLLKEFAEQKP